MGSFFFTLFKKRSIIYEWTVGGFLLSISPGNTIVIPFATKGGKHVRKIF